MNMQADAAATGYRGLLCQQNCSFCSRAQNSIPTIPFLSTLEDPQQRSDIKMVGNKTTEASYHCTG